MAQLRQALVAAHPHLGDIDEVAENEWSALPVKKPGSADFRNAVTDFYLTNPIARASTLMAELSANAKARKSAPLAAE
jgi:NADH-quinone oxidoreductase subunit G